MPRAMLASLIRYITGISASLKKMQCSGEREITLRCMIIDRKACHTDRHYVIMPSPVFSFANLL